MDKVCFIDIFLNVFGVDMVLFYVTKYTIRLGLLGFHLHWCMVNKRLRIHTSWNFFCVSRNCVSVAFFGFKVFRASLSWYYKGLSNYLYILNYEIRIRRRDD